MVCNLSHLFNNDHVGDTSGTQNGDICQAIDILPFHTENKRARDNGYHKVWHREALWGSSISKISTILLIVCLVLVTNRQLGEAYHSPMTLPNYNDHVTGVPPPVEAHGYKVELEKPFCAWQMGNCFFMTSARLLIFCPSTLRIRGPETMCTPPGRWARHTRLSPTTTPHQLRSGPWTNT